MKKKVNLTDLNISELEQFVLDIGEKKFRAKQIFRWIASGVSNIDEMTDLSKPLRDKLKECSYVCSLQVVEKLVSKIDGTIKYLLRLDDGNVIESVLMKYIHGYSICISSQIGCKMGCKFCASTGIGFVRNLTAGEILAQVLTVQKDSGNKVSNIVMMGIGEPLDNYDNVIKFLKLVNDKDGLNIGYRHISLSTCGLVPKILDLAVEKMPITLSVSLHSPDDKIRESMMPINKRYSIDKIIEACKIYIKTTRRRITFEYALVDGVNDSEKIAYMLAKLIKGMLCHVNLIPVNTVEGNTYRKSKGYSIERFKKILMSYGIQTTVRRELGSDIKAACGQLRRSKLDENR